MGSLNCSGLTAGATYDCNDLPQPGVNARLVLMNMEDISAITEASNVISAITLLSGGKAAYAVQGVKRSVAPQYNLVTSDISVGYDHQIDFLAFQLSQAVKDNLEAMALNRIVAIVENRNDDGNNDAVFEVYGIGNGLVVTALQRIPNEQESSGAFRITLKTSDTEGKEKKMPQSFWDTDYATTLAKVTALLTPTA